MVCATPHSTPSVSTNISAAEKAKVETIVHQYLLEKPEVLLEAMQVLQNKQMEQAKLTVQQTQQDTSKFFDVLFRDDHAPMAGNPQGSITLVEFFDYQCPHCIDMMSTLDALTQANPNLRIIYREWPIRGSLSEFASRAALAAHNQNKYLPLHQALLSAKEPLSQNSILDLAKQAGLNVEQLQKDMHADAINHALTTNMQLAQNLKLFGTPAFFLSKTNGDGKNAIYLPGELSQEQLQNAINKLK